MRLDSNLFDISITINGGKEAGSLLNINIVSKGITEEVYCRGEVSNLDGSSTLGRSLSNHCKFHFKSATRLSFTRKNPLRRLRSIDNPSFIS